jgi:hypothetical protein
LGACRIEYVIQPNERDPEAASHRQFHHLFATCFSIRIPLICRLRVNQAPPPPSPSKKICARDRPALTIRRERSLPLSRTRCRGDDRVTSDDDPGLLQHCWKNVSTPNSHPLNSPILLSFFNCNPGFAEHCYSNSRPWRGMVCTRGVSV